MSNADFLLRRIKESRQGGVTYKHMRFTVERPSEMDIALLSEENKRTLAFSFEMVCGCVVGWDGVTEADLYPSGSNAIADYSAEVFRAWVKDETELYAAISSRVMEMIRDHREKMDSALGNSGATSTSPAA
jgi:hypothetical protein